MLNGIEVGRLSYVLQIMLRIAETTKDSLGALQAQVRRMWSYMRLELTLQLLEAQAEMRMQKDTIIRLSAATAVPAPAHDGVQEKLIKLVKKYEESKTKVRPTLLTELTSSLKPTSQNHKQTISLYSPSLILYKRPSLNRNATSPRYGEKRRLFNNDSPLPSLPQQRPKGRANTEKSVRPGVEKRWTSRRNSKRH